MSNSQIIDFAALKARISIRDVLLRYCDDFPAEGKSQLRIPCPLCEYTKNCLSVSTEKNIFKCFHCQSQGNILDFVTYAEDVTLIEAGRLLAKWFPETKKPKNKKRSGNISRKGVKEQRKPKKVKAENPVQENHVLGFELKNIDKEHEVLSTLGLPDHVLVDYEIGYYPGKGMLKDTIVMPIRRSQGDLISYLGLNAERRVIYPPGDKFDPRSDLFGLNFPATGISCDSLYLVGNPVDVLVCAAFSSPAVATMSSLPSVSDCEALNGLQSQFNSFCYLIRDDQKNAEIGKICRILLEKTALSWEYRSLEQQFLSS